MNCRTWNNLFEQYEKVALERLERKRDFYLPHSELDAMNTAIAQALRDLHDHEVQHGCH